MRILCCLMAVIAMVLATPASANGWRNGGGFHVQAPRQQPDRFQRQPQRDFRNSQPDRGPRDGRMTDQDRRDLHRDLDRANRELYKGRR